jgi:hypothetical protein
MDRNDSNPGMVERQMDETPMEGSGTERESMQGSGSVERDSSESGGQRADNMEGMMPATNADGGINNQMMRADQREGGYGYDRPVDTTPTRDMDPQERSADRDGMHGAGREGSNEGSGERTVGDQGRETTGEGIARDW